jgi:hypothetical protein
MDPKLLLLLPVIANCPTAPSRPTMRRLNPPSAPIYNWPEHHDYPEKTEPPHGEGSTESPMYGGMAVYGTQTVNVSAALVTFDSGASGTQPYVSMTWLANRLPLVVSVADLDVGPVLPRQSMTATQVAPDSTKHRMNPSTIQSRRSITRRRG